MKQCKSCENKEKCKAEGSLCSHDLSHFIPDDDSRQFFSRWWVGNDQYEYHFNTNNEQLTSTHAIFIDDIPFCPYCGDVMYSFEKNRQRLHCCICEGARSEQEYEQELEAMKFRHEQELNKLKETWANKLTFDIKKLFEKKQQMEREAFDRREQVNMIKTISPRYVGPGHITTLNGHPLRNMEDLLTVH